MQIDRMPKMQIEAARGIKDLKDILDGIDEKVYSTNIELLSSSSIGQHVRHIIEFYQCLLGSLDSGVVNYCRRNRDKVLETDLEQVRHASDTILTTLQSLKENYPLQLETNLEGTSVVDSNLDRELLYCMEHAIHHMAMIKVGLKLLTPEKELPSHFGVAESTLKHHLKEASYSEDC